jgi:hypothetical protein
MSTKGKRVIYAGPADGSNHKPLNVEGLAVSAVLPGTILKETAAGLDANDKAATVFGERLLVADKDQQRTKSVDDAWTVGESMVAIAPRSGEFMNVLVATAQALIVGTALARNGAGLLVIAATGGTVEIAAYSDETITTSGTELVRVTPA